jgi:hypothetical protein
MSTAENQLMLGCWMQWMASMLAMKGGFKYKLKVERLPPPRNNGTTLTNRQETYREALRRKLRLILHTLATLPKCEALLFTDPDVMPIAPYSRLIEHLGSVDARFMSAATVQSGPVNAGFFLLRKTTRTLELLQQQWIPKVTLAAWNDQEILNRKVLRCPRTASPPNTSTCAPARFPWASDPGSSWTLHWDTWQRYLVAGNADGKWTSWQ